MNTTAGARAEVGSSTASALALEGVTRRHGGGSAWAPLDLALEPGTVCVVTGAKRLAEDVPAEAGRGPASPVRQARRHPGPA